MNDRDEFLRLVIGVAWKREPFIKRVSHFRLRDRYEALPALLRDAYLGKDTQGSLEGVFALVFDQGSRLPNAPIVIPFLARLLEVLDGEGIVNALDYLVLLAVGWESECLGRKGIEACSVYDEVCYELVGKQLFRIYPLLEHPEERVRVSATRVFSWFPNSREEVLEQLRDLSSSRAETEKVIALVSRGILKDKVEMDIGTSKRVSYALNAAYCETQEPDEANLTVFLDMCNWRYDGHSMGDFCLEPFGFSLGQYAGEVLHKQGTDFLRAFLDRAVESPFRTIVTTDKGGVRIAL